MRLPEPPARRYTGCLLRDVLNAAKPTESKPRELRRSYVVAAASDGYEVVFSWGELFLSPAGENVYVVYERDGARARGRRGPHRARDADRPRVGAARQVAALAHAARGLARRPPGYFLA